MEKEFTYDPWADVYDLLYTDTMDDLQLYCAHAKKLGGPVLEMACGTGRLLLPLALEGYEAWGIDSAPAMLDVARAKLGKMPPDVQARVHLSVQDMRDFKLDARFNLIFCAFRSFLHLMAPADRKKGLARAHEHLADGGRLIIDIFAPFHHLLAQAKREIVEVFSLGDGRKMVKHDLIRNNPAQQLIHVDSTLEEYDRNVMVRKTLRVIDLCWIHRYEMEHLLELSGFRLVDVLGTFDGKPYDYSSGEAIYIAEKA